MLRYITRRALYMIPTLFGIVLITFLLFNVAGGDQAKKKLGQQARAQRLEEYDIQRGYNKPLLCGHWGGTRAYRSDFSINAAPWGQIEGVDYTNRPGCIRLQPRREFKVPMAFEPYPGEQYRWTIVSRAGKTAGAPTFEIRAGSNVIRRVALGQAAAWETTSVVLDTPADTADLNFVVVTGDEPFEIRRFTFQRRAGSFFDSQLVFYIRQIAHFDFGVSAETNQRVSTMILDGILPSLALTVPIFFIGLIVEICLALFCAFFRNSFIDRFFVIISVAMMSLPYLVWIIGGQYILAYGTRAFPVWGFESMKYIVLPVIIGVISGIGGGVRFYRTIMLDEMYKDYVRTAFAKGVTRSGVLFKHVLKNAMIPILTSVVMAIPFLYTGSLLLESFFGIPGLGNLSVNGVLNSDFDVVRAAVLVGAIIYLIANLVTDICYTLVDPRVKLR